MPPRRLAPSLLSQEEMRLIDRPAISAVNCNASRHALRPHDNDASHPICLEKLVQFLLHDKAPAARGMTDEYALVVAHDNSRVKHIQVLACRYKKDKVTALQMRFERWHRCL